eukprot:TRINITY_DN10390_c0_g1_i12.p1 TRINITY_DN10390_c0_g1~~TRINITY_DN10390_c0_g1_i12.p1  ORF type:complete len:500 (+),score=121.51 TRINITY_DN10390_c0_g1_i12:98-1597(+)
MNDGCCYGTFTVLYALVISNDKNDLSIFQIGTAGQFIVNAAVTVSAYTLLLGKINIPSGSVLASGAFLMTSTSSKVNCDGGNLTLSSDNAQCTSGAIQSTSASYGLNVAAGTVAVKSAFKLVTIFASSFSPTTSGSARQLLATPQPVYSACTTTGSVGSNFGHSSTLEILTCSTSGCTCSADTPAVAYKVVNSLTMARGSFLKFTEVGSTSFGILEVTGQALFENGANINVFLSSTLTESATEIALMKFQPQGTQDCNLSSTVSLGTPITTNRKWDSVTRFVTSSTGSTACWLYLSLDTTPPTAVVEQRALNYQSVNKYFLTLNKDCAVYGKTEFLDAFTRASITGRGILPSNTISVTSAVCASVRVDFSCLSTVSPQDADAICTQVVSDATTPGTPLHNEVRGVSGSTVVQDDDGSNTALFGLLALCALPIICLVGFVLMYKNSQRTADNQYMEDTARFSNVAASPQPLRQFNGVPPMYETGPAYQPAIGYAQNPVGY